MNAFLNESFYAYWSLLGTYNLKPYQSIYFEVPDSIICGRECYLYQPFYPYIYVNLQADAAALQYAFWIKWTVMRVMNNWCEHSVSAHTLCVRGRTQCM